MRKTVLLIAIILGVGGGIAFAVYLYLASNTYTNRFRLTIEIDTPEGIKSGSSVIETSAWESRYGFAETRGVRGDARGEAVFVDLGRNLHLVAVLGWGPKGEDQDKIFGLKRAALARGLRIDWTEEYKLKGKGELPRDYVPTLVTFANRDDPTSVRVVPTDGLEQAFGPGFRFRRATIETTADPLRQTITRRLRWLPHPRYLSGRSGCDPAAPHCLHGGNFLR